MRCPTEVGHRAAPGGHRGTGRTPRGRLSPVKWLVPALVQWGINVLGLMVADWVFSGFSIERWGPLLFAGAVLGLANAFLKPLLTFIALPLILLTFGIAYFFVNIVMLLFTEWVTPDFSIDGFWTYVGATIVIWLVNWIVWTLVDSLAGEAR